MLRLNRETDYAIRVILALAGYPPGEIVPSAVIQEKKLLPRSLSLQIISRLSHLKLINTFPGRGGGIQLALPPDKINLHQIIEGMEGPIILSDCLEVGHECQLAQECPVQSYWVGLQSVVERELKSATIESLTNPSINAASAPAAGIGIESK